MPFDLDAVFLVVFAFFVLEPPLAPFFPFAGEATLAATYLAGEAALGVFGLVVLALVVLVLVALVLGLLVDAFLD